MLSVIVVDYNSIKKTIEYILHLSENIMNIGEFHAVIVDNYLNSNAIEILTKQFINYNIIEYNDYNVFCFSNKQMCFLYINSGANLGYAKGNNLGIEIVKIFYPYDEFVLISNNDLILKEKIDWGKIKKLYDNDEKLCIVAPKIVGLDGKVQSPNRRLNSWTDFVWQYWINLKPFKWRGDIDYSGKSKYCYRVSGCFFFAKLSLLCKAGAFDPNTFMYAEEMILSERLKKIDALIYFYDDYSVLHNHGETVKQNSNFLQSEQWNFNSYLYYFKKYRGISSFNQYIAKISFNIYKMRRYERFYIKKLIYYIKNLSNEGGR